MLRVLVCCLLIVASLPASELPISEQARIEWQLPRGTFNVGDELQIRLSYRWPADWPVLLDANPARDFAEATLTKADQTDRRTSGGEVEVIWQVALLVERSGAWELPTPRLVLQGPDGPVQAQCQGLLLQVGLPEGEPALEEPRGLWTRPPVDLPISTPWYWWAVPALVIIVGAVIALLLIRRPKAVTPVAAEALARQALQRARQASDGKQAAGIISLALRRYCGSIWSFDGVGATADETVLYISMQATDAERQDLRKLFRDLDELRWAPGELTAITVGPYVDQALAWLHRVVERQQAEQDREAA